MTDDVKKGFNTTVGIILALCFVFIVLPLGTCAGCVVLGAGVSATDEISKGAAAGAATDAPSGIEISNIVFKILDDNQFMHEATYKFDVTNRGTRPVTKSFEVQFQDADGLPLDSTRERRKPIPAGGTVTISGKTAMSPEKGSAVATMLVEER